MAPVDYNFGYRSAVGQYLELPATGPAHQSANLSHPFQKVQVQVPRVNAEPRLSNGRLLSTQSYDVSQRSQLVYDSGSADWQPATPLGNGIIPLEQLERQEERPPLQTSKQDTNATSIEYPRLLLGLAEEFFQAAYGNEKATDPQGYGLNQATFQKMVATGLGCLEAVLKNWRLQPMTEALTRLAYASILFQDTNNLMEAEEALSKGISHCERYRLLDLKYKMQHLLVRVTSRTSSRASTKFLENVIKEADVQEHVPWGYAFRFLRVSLMSHAVQPQEISIALSHLRAIANLAHEKRDPSVAAMASAIEALIHVRHSKSQESIEQAQRALASARSSLLAAGSHPPVQTNILVHFGDLCCSLFQDDLELTIMKMGKLHSILDDVSADSLWMADERFELPVSIQSSQKLPASGPCGGVIRLDTNGIAHLQMRWLSRDEVHAVGHLVSAIVVVHKNAQDMKAERFLEEAIGRIEALSSAPARDESWRLVLQCHVRVSLVMTLCGRNAWSAARKELASLKQLTSCLPSELATAVPVFVQYLEGVISQGTGDTSSALTIFSQLVFLLKAKSSSANTPVERDLAILAALNTVLIIHHPNHPKHTSLPSLLSMLESLVPQNQSRNTRAAYHLIRAISFVLQEAKRTANNQLMCITLNFMAEKFFRGVVGEQPVKSARSALQLARRGQNDLWTSVAKSLLADVLDTQGRGLDADEASREAREIAGRLPDAMKREQYGVEWA